jgi:hypothetical protein
MIAAQRSRWQNRASPVMMLPFTGKDAQQLQGGLMLVGLGIDSDLAQNRLGFGQVGGDEMLAGHFPLPAAARGLAVQGDE